MSKSFTKCDGRRQYREIIESKASFWEVLESSNREIVANYITFAASNYCRGQDTTERQTPRATESGRNYKAGRRKINQRQLRGSRSKHILGNTKSLGSSTLRDFHWGAAHFPSQSPLYRWDLDGAGHISRLCPANCTQETECQWHVHWGAAPLGAVPQCQPRTSRRECEVHCCTTDRASPLQLHQLIRSWLAEVRRLSPHLTAHQSIHGTTTLQPIHHCSRSSSPPAALATIQQPEWAPEHNS